MLLYALSACLWLLASGEESILEDARVRFHKSSTPLMPNYLIAPEILDGRRTFFVLEYNETSFDNKRMLRVRVRKYDDKPGIEPLQCVFNHITRFAQKRIGVDEFHRIGDNDFVYTWYAETNRTLRRTEIEYSSVPTCQRQFVSPKVLHGHTRLVPVKTATDVKTFAVLTNDTGICRGYSQRCQIRYNLLRKNKGERLLFNVSFDWNTLHAEFLPSQDYVVRGNEGKYHKIALLSAQTGKRKLLKQWPDEHRLMDVVSSGTAFCWIADPVHDRKTVSCEVTNEWGDKVFSKSLQYDEPVDLVSVKPMKEDGEFFLLTKKFDCTDEANCWILYGTRVRTNATIKLEHVPLYFLCTGDIKKLAVLGAVPDDEWTRMDLYYACRRDNSYTFSVFWVY